jgi:sulfite reductase (NADPH) flavoprotein alpha-component
VLHVELDVAGSGISYSAGDSLAVAPANSPQLVEALLQRLGLDGDRVFSVQAAEGQGGEGQVRKRAACRLPPAVCSLCRARCLAARRPPALPARPARPAPRRRCCRTCAAPAPCAPP